MLKDILDRIEERLQAVGLTATEASRRAGMSPDAIRNFRRAVRDGKESGASTKTLEKLAPILGVSMTWLTDGDAGSPPGSKVQVEPGLRRVVVAGHVQAGEWMEAWEWDFADQYPIYVPDLPEYRSIKLYAAETRGPSMNRRYPEGTVVVFADVQQTGEDPIPGKRYVVERCRSSGECEHTVKLLAVDAEGKHWLVPESDDPRYQAPISVEEGVDDGDTVTIIGRVVFSVNRE